MAGTRSGRSASRKSTPISPPKQSTSKSTADSRSSKRRRIHDEKNSKGRTSRDASVESGASTATDVRRKGKAAAVPSSKLSPVNEVVGAEFGSPAERMALRERSVDEQSEATSAISSVARREEMVFGLEALEAESEQILRFLASKDFSDRATVQSFQNPHSLASERLRKLLSRLRESCEAFEDSDDLVPFDCRVTVQKLIGARHWQEVSDGQWRPDALFQRANLVTFVVEVLGPDAQSIGEYGLLEIMRNQFPNPFMYGFKDSTGISLGKGYSNLLQETFEVGLEIRTQYAISLMTHRMSERNFDPDDVLNQVFYLGDDEETPQLTGFRVEGLSVQDMFLPKEFALRVLRRIQAMKEHFSEHAQSSVDIRSLKASFPWQDFIAQTMTWVQARAAELRQQIDVQGGVGKIQLELTNQQNLQGTKTPHEALAPFRTDLSNSKDLNEIPIKPPTTTNPGLPLQSNGRAKPARKSLGEEAKRLEQLKAQLPQRSGLVAQASQEAQPLRRVNAEASPPLETHFDEPPRSSLAQLLEDPSVRVGPVAAVVTTVEKQGRQSNKENINIISRPKSFIDRQPGAKKVPWGEDGVEVISENRRTHQSPRKRRRGLKDVHGDGDNEDDDEFEHITSVAPDRRRNELRKKTGERLTTQNPSSYRPRSEVPESVLSNRGAENHPDYELDEGDQSHDRQRSSSSANRSSGRSSQGLPPSTRPARNLPRSSDSTDMPRSSCPPPSTGQQITQVRERARQNVARLKHRRIQSRSRYDVEEELRLQELIEEYGTSYALIKQMDENHPDGPLLQDRTQVQLKDKAQEMKFTILRAGAVLPYNFDKIALRQRMKDQLEALGIFQGY